MESRNDRQKSIAIEEENLLWEKGVLRDGDPQTLIDTMLFLYGICFALRSIQEHLNLKLPQLSDQDGAAYLLYTDNTSKNNQGGLSHRKIKSRTVACFENISNPQRCLVRTFQKYLTHRPTQTRTHTHLLENHIISLHVHTSTTTEIK